MTIYDKYHNNKDINFNGKDLTVHVGTFSVDGDIEVSGQLTITGNSSIQFDLVTDDPFTIVGNSYWYFKNDSKVFLYYNDTGLDGNKEIIIGKDFFNSTGNDNIDSTTSGGDKYYYGQVNLYSARSGGGRYSTLYAEHAGLISDSMSVANFAMTGINRANLTNAQKFLSFYAADGLAADFQGHNDGVKLNVYKNFALEAPDQIIIESTDVVISNKGNLSNLVKENLNQFVTPQERRWFFPQKRTIHYYSYSHKFDLLKGPDYPNDTNLGTVISNGDLDFLRTDIELPIGPATSRVLSVDIMWGQDDTHDLVADNTGRYIGVADWFGTSPYLSTNMGTGVGWKLKADGSKYHLEIWLDYTEMFDKSATNYTITADENGDHTGWVNVDLHITVDYRDL